MNLNSSKGWRNVLKFTGVIVLITVLVLLSGCFDADETYSIAEEQYLMGWILHNVNDSTNTVLDYSLDELAIYNYTFNYPANQPQTYSNVLFWLAPVPNNGFGAGAAAWTEIDVPLDRTYYLKGNNPIPENYRTNWSFCNYMHVNYLVSNDSSVQFGFERAHEEHYNSEAAFNAITPTPGDRKHVYFGTAPFIPTSVVIENNCIMLKDHLMRGYGGKSYLLRDTETAVGSSSGETTSIYTAVPTYKIYLDGELQQDGNLTDYYKKWDYSVLNYPLSQNGNYLVNITIPTNYPVWNTTIMTAQFNKPSSDINPPILNYIEVSPHFDINQSVSIVANISDDSSITNVSICYNTDIDDNWICLPVNSSYPFYDTSLLIINNSINKINLKLFAEDNYGNNVSYLILPVSLRSRTIDLNFTTSKTSAKKGEELWIGGRCTDSLGLNCSGLRLEYYLNNNYLGADRTDFENEYESIKAGEFGSNFIIPYNFTLPQANFSVVFEGTGIYPAREETVCVNIITYDHDLAVGDLILSVFKLSQQGYINSTIYNIGHEDEINITVKFLIDEDIKNNTFISQLASGDSKDISFNWTPTQAGKYNISIYLDPVSGENETENNRRESSVTVGSDLSASIVYMWGTKIIVNQTTVVKTETSNIGNEDAVNVTLHLVDLTENVTIDSFNISTICVNKKKTIEFIWTPSTIGYHELKFIVNATNDADLSNNCDTSYLYVHPPENSVVCGYITDAVTNATIGDAWVSLDWQGEEGHYDWNYTYSDSSGLYHMNVAAGEFDLYISADGYFYDYLGPYEIGEFETLWINVSMDPRPPETSIVCGYVNDSATGLPIEDAEIQLRWKDDLDHYYYNYTYTDSFGFYAINAAAGQNRISVYANGYFDEYTGYHDIEEDETLWLNISMVSRPPETSIVCGYVNDSETGLPIEDAYVDLDWRDNSDHYDWNGTYTDSSGFYSMNVAAGEFDLYVRADGYFGESTGYYNYEIGEYETLTINVSLWPAPPENSIVCGYITDEETDLTIEDAEIQLRWKDDLDHYYYNYTYTDSFGFYAINAAAGQNRISVSADGYYFNNTDYFMVNDYDTLLVNVSLQPKPPENSVVCGYITDEETGLPIEDAYVDLDWHDNQDHWYWNYTYTDSSGFYSMNVAAGEIYLYIYADGYFYNYLGPYEIGEFEILWINVSMDPKPPETSIVCGYVNDSETGLPIEDAYVRLDWRDNSDHYDWNGTYTDSSGFYSMNVAAGEISLYVSAGQGYISGYTEWSTIGENESLWLNFTLEKDDILPTISNLTIPEYVGQNHPGNISANISDKNLQCVYILLFDCYNITYNQSFVMWYYLDDTGINDTYAIKNYSGTYANLKQGINSTPTTILTLSNSAETKKIYTLAYFKKNQTSSWAQIVLEFNLSNGILDNIATISMSPNGTMELDYITSMIESGVSLVTPLSIYLDGGNSLWINYTLYTIGSSGNPYLNWSKLNNGEYGGIVMASDKASNVNSTTFNLTVSHDFYNISGTVFYNGTETGAIDIALFDEYIGEGSEPIAWTSISSPGNYTFEVINGTYYLGAYMDINGNGYCDEEPLGFAINKTFGQQINEIIVNGSNMDGIDITLYQLPDTVYVDDDFNSSIPGWQYDHFDSIQDGIDAVCGNGTVYVFNGTYFENVTIDKTINLVGEDTLTTIIESLIPVSTVIIMADNVTMKNFSIGFSSCGDIGIRVLSCKNLQIGCCNIDSSGEAGIELESDCENVLIFNCSSTASSCGIYVHEVNNIVVMNCNLSNNQLTGLWISDSYQIQVRNSMVSLNDEYGIFLFNSSEFNISDCVIRDNDWAGIRFNYSSNSTVQDCEMFGSISGIYFDESSNNTIFDCFIYNNTQNIHLNNANYDNVLRNLNIMGGQVGVQLYTSSTNEITNCSVSNNEYGIFFGGFSLFSASNNVISGCNIFNNDYGVMIESSKNNNVFYNNYFNNTNNAIDNGTNIWNISKIIGMNIIGGNWLGGNYWSDYTGVDTDGDGLGNTSLPYNCSGNIQNGGDWLPLVLSSGPNDSPVIFDENPVNGSTGVDRPPIDLNATVEDPDGDIIDVYIRWKKHDYNHLGEWVLLKNYTDVGSGTYSFTPPLENDWIWGNTTYNWSVNVTDRTSWTNETYEYTTGGSRYDVNNNDIVNFQDADSYGFIELVK